MSKRLGRDRPTGDRADESAGAEIESLEARVTALEAEVQECRKLNLRLAEVVDVVQELLLPISQRDDDKVEELLERYRKSLG